MRHDWLLWAHWAQRRPLGAWRTWLFLGGRGAGKTRAGAEWVAACARAGRFGRFALIGPTFHDVREVMVAGQSGLMASETQRPSYEATRRRIVWPNGAQALCFSAEDPESLRGPQFDAAWCDELAYWPYPDETLTTLSHAMRLGEAPRLVVTTTPRPMKALRQLLKGRDVAVTRASTWENAENLAPDFIAALRERWIGTAHDRQEIMGELVEDPQGAYWTRGLIERARIEEWPELERVVVAVDPPVSVGPDADACGIVAAGCYRVAGRPRAVVLADASVQGVAPADWAMRAAGVARSLGASCIVAEANNGGELVRTVLNVAAPDLPVRLVHARIPKAGRAELASMHYGRGHVRHAAAFPELEDEMCAFGAPGFKGSPDRLDALAWALHEVLGRGEPVVRSL